MPDQEFKPRETMRSAELRGQLMHMLARGFMHPSADFHKAVSSGRYQDWLGQLARAYAGETEVIGPVNINAMQFEAAYISLFHAGNPEVIGLHAGNYDLLLDGRSRAEFMLDYVSWYKHFGLEVRQGDSTAELPDHLVCQFEFLAWLAGLEADPDQSRELQSGYRAARNDFLTRHLLPFLDLLRANLSERAEPPVIFYTNLLELAILICNRMTVTNQVAL